MFSWRCTYIYKTYSLDYDIGIQINPLSSSIDLYTGQIICVVMDNEH